MTFHLHNLDGRTLGILAHDLVHTRLGADLLCIPTEVECLDRLLGIGRQLRYAANHSCLALSDQRALQDSGQFAVAETDESFALGTKLRSYFDVLDDATEGKKGLVDVTGLLLSSPSGVGIALAFRPGKIHDVDLRSSNLLAPRIDVLVVDGQGDAED